MGWEACASPMLTLTAILTACTCLQSANIWFIPVRIPTDFLKKGKRAYSVSIVIDYSKIYIIHMPRPPPPPPTSLFLFVILEISRQIEICSTNRRDLPHSTPFPL
jgi:hypothetical protein